MLDPVLEFLDKHQLSCGFMDCKPCTCGSKEAEIYYKQVLEKLNELNEMKSVTYCAYCGDEFDVDGDASLVSGHIKSCLYHPMRQVEYEREKLLGYVTNLENYVLDHFEGKDLIERWIRDNRPSGVGVPIMGSINKIIMNTLEEKTKAEEEKTKAELDMLCSLVVEYIEGHHWSWEDKCELCKRAIGILGSRHERS